MSVTSSVSPLRGTDNVRDIVLPLQHKIRELQAELGQAPELRKQYAELLVIQQDLVDELDREREYHKRQLEKQLVDLRVQMESDHTQKTAQIVAIMTAQLHDKNEQLGEALRLLNSRSADFHNIGPEQDRVASERRQMDEKLRLSRQQLEESERIRKGLEQSLLDVRQELEDTTEVYEEDIAKMKKEFDVKQEQLQRTLQMHYFNEASMRESKWQDNRTSLLQIIQTRDQDIITLQSEHNQDKLSYEQRVKDQQAAIQWLATILQTKRVTPGEAAQIEELLSRCEYIADFRFQPLRLDGAVFEPVKSIKSTAAIPDVSLPTDGKTAIETSRTRFQPTASIRDVSDVARGVNGMGTFSIAPTSVVSITSRAAMMSPPQQQGKVPPLNLQTIQSQSQPSSPQSVGLLGATSSPIRPLPILRKPPTKLGISPIIPYQTYSQNPSPIALEGKKLEGDMSPQPSSSREISMNVHSPASPRLYPSQQQMQQQQQQSQYALPQPGFYEEASPLKDNTTADTNTSSTSRAFIQTPKTPTIVMNNLSSPQLVPASPTVSTPTSVMTVQTPTRGVASAQVIQSSPAVYVTPSLSASTPVIQQQHQHHQQATLQTQSGASPRSIYKGPSPRSTSRSEYGGLRVDAEYVDSASEISTNEHEREKAGEMEKMIALKLNEKVSGLLKRSHIEAMMTGSFLAKLGTGLTYAPVRSPKCKFFMLSSDSERVLCTQTAFGVIPKNVFCRNPCMYMDTSFVLGLDSYVITGRPAVFDVKTASSLNHEQLQFCFTVVCKSTGTNLSLMAYSKEDFILWTDGLRMVLGHEPACPESIAEKTRLKELFCREYDWMHYQKSFT